MYASFELALRLLWSHPRTLIGRDCSGPQVGAVVPILQDSNLPISGSTDSLHDRVFIKLTWHDRGPDHEGGPVLSTARLALCLRCLG